MAGVRAMAQALRAGGAPRAIAAGAARRAALPGIFSAAARSSPTGAARGLVSA
jgi:hypothetical protein